MNAGKNLVSGVLVASVSVFALAACTVSPGWPPPTTTTTTTVPATATAGAPSGGTYNHTTNAVAGTTVTITASSGSMASATLQFRARQKHNGNPISDQYIQVTCALSGPNATCTLPSTTLQYSWVAGVTVEVSVQSVTSTPQVTSINTSAVVLS